VTIAYLFPGQGSQAVGMGRALATAHPEAKTAFDEADEALGFALSDLMWNGPEVAHPGVGGLGVSRQRYLR
jgi:[acyl-carrier-protein] S-malonyltransferase